MSTKQQEQLALQTNAEEVNKSISAMTGKYEFEKLEGTPFHIVGNPEQGFCLTLGMYRISEFKEYKYDIEKLVDEDKWNIIMALIMVVMDIKKEEVTE